MSEHLDLPYLAVAAVAGLVFGFGLYISQMVDPMKVLHFLDFTAIPIGGWDPRLAFVMATGLIVMLVAVRIGRARGKPVFDVQFHEPEFTRLDRPLLIGAALFGVGWGMSGICPGPAISLMAFWPQNLLIYLLALFVGSYGGSFMIPSGRGKRLGPRPMTDTVVVGGGLAGLAAAVAVAKARLETIHLVPKGPPDRRTSALMLPSVEYLQSAGLVPDPAAVGHPLTQIRIIDATNRLIRAPETLFDSAEIGQPAFGWNFPNVKLAEAFEASRAALPNLSTIETTLDDLSIEPDGATLRLGNGDTLRAPLVVGADGKKSRVRESAGFRARENGFTQAALVCDLGLERPIGGASIEFHYENGPLTLVPAGGNRANLVWIEDRDTLKAAQEGGKENLAALFREKSQRLFGDIELLTPAHMFLLSTLTVDIAGKDGIVLVGEAAHAFPPIGAQGLNLGLRDVADLAASLAAADLTAPGYAKALSEDYAQRRAADLARTGTVVDALFRSLLAEFLPTQAVRAGGLWALKLLPPLRKTAFDVGMGVR